MATKKSKKPAKKRQPRVSIADQYMVATDAIEEGGTNNLKVAAKMVTSLRAAYPDYPVPVKAREVIPFDAHEVIEDVARAMLMRELGSTGEAKARKTGCVLDPDQVANLMDHLSITDVSNGFEITGDKSGNEWAVVHDEDVAIALALEGVKQDLRDEPGIFNADFIARHIDQEKLKKVVYDSRYEDDYINELNDRDFWQMAKRYGIEDDDESEDGPDREKVEDDVKEAYAAEAAKDPEDFFRDLYGGEATQYMIEAAGIDVDGAAQAAIDEDGWQHFIASYDGHSYETSAGFVFWRTN